jgi:hypothetical protein
MPWSDSHAMDEHVAEISRHFSAKSACSQSDGKQHSQFMRDNWLSSQVVRTYEAIRNDCCNALCRLIANPRIIASKVFVFGRIGSLL